MWGVLSREQIKTGSVNGGRQQMLLAHTEDCWWINAFIGNECDRQMQAQQTQRDEVLFNCHLIWVEKTNFVFCFCPAEHTNTHGKTHLPNHGCQSSQGWLQDIILSVSGYEQLNHTVEILSLIRLLWTDPLFNKVSVRWCLLKWKLPKCNVGLKSRGEGGDPNPYNTNPNAKNAKTSFFKPLRFATKN